MTKKMINLPDSYWERLLNEYGNLEIGLQEVLEAKYPNAESRQATKSKTDQILFLLSKGLRTSASLSEHMPTMQRSSITALLNQMCVYGYVEIDKNEWPRVYTITEKGLEKLNK